MLRTRLISGVFLVAGAVLFICLGGWVLWSVMLLISLIGMWELYRVCGICGPSLTLPAAAGMVTAVGYYLLIACGYGSLQTVWLALGFILIMAVYVFTYPKYNSGQVMAVGFGVIYVAVMLSYIYQTRCLTDGEYTAWLIMFSSWGCDSFAYLFGRLFGKHKMSPHLSPKKTVEGAIGGVAGAAALGALYAWIIGPYMSRGAAPVWEYALICGAGGLVSMVGDLAASAIKRNHDVKDYGKLIPGHGGIMDRFDSVIFTAPIIWLLASLFV